MRRSSKLITCINVTPSFTVQPDIQGVFRPNGTGLISDALVLAVQMAITLIGEIRDDYPGRGHRRYPQHESPIVTFEGGQAECVVEEIYPSIEYHSLDAIVGKFVASYGRRSKRACFAVPGPVRDGRVQTTNLPWTVGASRLEQDLGLKTVALINDLEAIAFGIDVLKPKDLAVVSEGGREPPGTPPSLPPALAWVRRGSTGTELARLPFACEGGHTDFAPIDDLQYGLFRYLSARFGHVCWERVVSGPGLCSHLQLSP